MGSSELGNAGFDRNEQWADSARQKHIGPPKNSLTHGLQIQDYSRGSGCVTSTPNPELNRNANRPIHTAADSKALKFQRKVERVEKLTPKPRQRTTASELSKLAYAALPTNQEEVNLAKVILDHMESGKKRFEKGKLKGSPADIVKFLTAYNEVMPKVEPKTKLFDLNEIYNKKEAQLSEEFNKDEILFVLELGNELALQESEIDKAGNQFQEQFLAKLATLSDKFSEQFAKDEELNEVIADIKELNNQ